MSKREVKAFKTNRREKRKVPEIQPPEPKLIECIYNKNISITETNFKNFIRIKDNKFPRIRSNYIYQINFPKDSLLQQIYANSFCFLNLYSITFPPSLSIIMPESFNGCKFLKDINFISNDPSQNILEICDNAFRDTIIETIVIPKNTKNICSLCFPRTLKQIEFECGSPKLEKIGNKAFYQTQIESFKFPLNFEIFIFPKNVFLQCKNLKTLIFDSYSNKKVKFQPEIEDELFEKEKRIEKKFKFNKTLSKLNKSIENPEKNKCYKYIERSQDFAKSYLISQTKVEKLEVHSSNLNYFYFFNTPKLTSITVGEGENSRYIKIKGCIYTRDKKNLVVAERNIKSAIVSSSCQLISNYAFNVKSLEKVNFEKNSELKEISFFAFSESKINKLDIPESVDLIDYCTFYKCNKLETVNIPKSVNSIDFFTFSYTNLTKIFIPKRVIKISFGSFFKCCNLTTVTFEPESDLVEIDDFAFSSTKIKSISIPKSVKRIGNYCFLNCTSLETVTFDNNSEILSIGNQCFYGTKIDPSQLNVIYQKVGLFYDRLNLDNYIIKTFDKDIITSVKFPKDLKIVERNAFKDFVNLAKVELNPFITKIMDGAFSNCTSLTDLEIPQNIEYLGNYCFQNCIKYEGKIKISNQMKVYVGRSAFENSGLVSFRSESRFIIVRKSAFQACKNLAEFEANAIIESIFGSFAFKNCKKMQIAIISPNVEKVSFGKCCFMNTAIQKFIVPINLEILPKCIFKNCLKLSEVQIDVYNSRLQCIKSDAFKLSGIKEICIPLTTRIIEDNSFSYCQKLNRVQFARNYLLKIKYSCFENCRNLKEIIMPETMNIKIIADNVFKGSSIESITFPKSIKLIQKHAFLKCDKLKTITFLDECKIESYAFSGCKNLERIKTNSILKVYYSFSDYPSITISVVDLKLFYLNIKKEITNKEAINSLFINEKPTFQSSKILIYKHFLILNDGFCLGDDLSFIDNDEHNNNFIICQIIDGGYYINSKKSIYSVDKSIDSLCILKETKFIESSAFRFSNLKKIDFQSGSQLEKIRKFSFMNLEIEEVSLPDSLISIGKQAFYNCTKLKKVNITPQSKLKIIKSNAFEKCGVESFVFPSALEKIDNLAFFECFYLKEIKNYSEKIEFGYKSFCRSGIENIKFPSKSTFLDSSFKECAHLKEIVFDGERHVLVFGPESFALSGIETFKVEDNFDIKENAFIFCHNLKEVFLTGNNVNIDRSSFDFCPNIEEFTYTYITDNNYIDKYNDHYIYNIIQIVSKSYVKKFLLKIITVAEDNSEIEQKLLLENNCFVYNNKLVQVNLIDNITPFKQSSKTTTNEIKGNEIIQVPSCVEKIDFLFFNSNLSINQIKQIKWSKDCIVNDLGSPGLFSYSSLVEITIPKSVQQIPDHLFEHCHSMKTVQFEKGSILAEIGEYAFSNTSIEKAILPDTVQVIKKSAFSFNPKLKEVSFKGEIIEEEAFLQTGLIEFRLSNNTKTIGSSAFQFCRSLKTFAIDIENSKLSELGPFSFYETSITEINIPPNIKVIQNSVFNGCKYLKQVNISNKSKLETIEEHSFSGNLSLKTINIPDSISNLSFKAFINTPSLIKIMNKSNSQFIVQSNNEVYMKDNSLIFVPRNLKEFEVIKNCSVIHSGSFCGPNLEKVTFQDDSLTSIEESGFAHSTSLKNIAIPKSIKDIGNDAFIECRNLETVLFNLNSTLKIIPQYCFAFSGLKNVVLPRSVEIIDKSSFYFCEHLKNIDLYDTNIEFIGESAFSGTGIEKVRFPPNIQFISNHSFEETKMLTTVDFSSCSKVENYYNKYSKSARDLIIKDKKKKKKVNKLAFSTPTLFQVHPPPPNNSPITPTNQLPLIIKPSVRNVTPRNSYNQPFKGQNPLKVTSPRKSLNKASPKIAKSKTSDETQQLRPKLNVTCFVCESAFYRSNASVFKFDLNEYQWFDFFNKCNQIKEYSLNSSIVIHLRKLHTERLHYFSINDYYEYVCSKSDTYISSFERKEILNSLLRKHLPDHLLGSCYKVSQIFWQGPDAIPWKLYGPKLRSIPKQLNPFHFMNTSNLISIIFTDDIQIDDIPKCCFSFTLLEEIRIPKSVRTICRSAFQYCNGLRKVTFSPDIQLKEIESYAFFDCKNLYSISLPGTISLIPEFCFASSSINEIIFPKSIETICSGAFHHCDNLSSIIFNEGLKEIGCSSFSNCNSLIKVELPNSLTIILPHAFSGCSNLRYINIKPESNLAFIKNGAFDFTSIEELKLNASIEEICDIRIENMPKLEKISFHKGKLLHFTQSKDGIVFQLMPKYLKFNDDDDDNEEEDDERFYDLQRLIFSLRRKYDRKFGSLYQKQKHIPKIIFIPKKITCLKYADEINIFGDLKLHEYSRVKDYIAQINQITQIKISSKLAAFSRGAFSDFNSITSVEFDENVNLFEISSYLFSNCKNLQKVVIPNSCVQICTYAFADCINLKTVLFGKVGKSFEKNYSLKYIEYRAFYNCSSLQNVVLPPTLIKIDCKAFMNCKSLKRLEIGTIYLNDDNKKVFHIDKENEKLEFIESSAFKNCSSLLSFRIPHSCKSIKENAFMNCTSLTKFSGKELCLREIGLSAFMNCSSLTSFHISVLNSIHYNDDNYEEYKEDHEKTPYFNIRSCCFMNCTSLKEFVIENESISIGTMNQDKNCCKSKICSNAFANCTSLTNAKFFIGNLSQVNRNAFMNCSSLKKIEINSPFYQSIINDDKMSFFGCNNDLTLELFNENKKINSFKIRVTRYTSIGLFKNHLSFLNRDLLSWPAKEEKESIKKVKLRSTVLNSFDGPMLKILSPRYLNTRMFLTPGPGSYSIRYHDNGPHFTIGHKTQSPIGTSNVATEYNYTIPTSRPPLNI